MRKLGRGFVFVLFLTHSSHNRFYPNFLQKGFFRFGGKPFFLTLHHLHKKTTTGNWNNYTGGHDWGKVSKPICTREEKGGPPKHKPAEFIGAQRRKKILGSSSSYGVPPQSIPKFSFFLLLPPLKTFFFQRRGRSKEEDILHEFHVSFFSSSSFLWPLSIFFFFFYHHHHSSSSLSYPRRTMQPRKKNIIITNENPDRLVLSRMEGE